METQQGEVCRFSSLSLWLTSVEVMSLISLGDWHIFIQKQQNNILKIYFTFQQMHVLWQKKYGHRKFKRLVTKFPKLLTSSGDYDNNR